MQAFDRQPLEYMTTWLFPRPLINGNKKSFTVAEKSFVLNDKNEKRAAERLTKIKSNSSAFQKFPEKFHRKRRVNVFSWTDKKLVCFLYLKNSLNGIFFKFDKISLIYDDVPSKKKSSSFFLQETLTLLNINKKAVLSWGFIWAYKSFFILQLITWN